MSKQPLLEELDPQLVRRMTSDPEKIWKANRAGTALNSHTVGLGALASTTFGQGPSLPQQIIDVLNFALTLEFLENEFYKMARNSKNLIPNNGRKVFDQISKHEEEHVKLLSSVLGSQATAKPSFDFTAGGAFADVFKNYQTFLAVSQAFEDTGVRAYKGQAGNLQSNAQILTTALQIHSVEARHASEVRRLRGQKGWITGDSRGNLPAPTQPIYDGEGNTTQGGANLAGMAGVPSSAITEAFDEPLTKEEVLAIAKLFIRS